MRARRVQAYGQARIDAQTKRFCLTDIFGKKHLYYSMYLTFIHLSNHYYKYSYISNNGNSIN